MTANRMIFLLMHTYEWLYTRKNEVNEYILTQNTEIPSENVQKNVPKTPFWPKIRKSRPEMSKKTSQKRKKPD